MLSCKVFFFTAGIIKEAKALWDVWLLLPTVFFCWWARARCMGAVSSVLLFVLLQPGEHLHQGMAFRLWMKEANWPELRAKEKRKGPTAIDEWLGRPGSRWLSGKKLN